MLSNSTIKWFIPLIQVRFGNNLLVRSMLWNFSLNKSLLSFILLKILTVVSSSSSEYLTHSPTHETLNVYPKWRTFPCLLQANTNYRVKIIMLWFVLLVHSFMPFVHLQFICLSKCLFKVVVCSTLAFFRQNPTRSVFLNGIQDLACQCAPTHRIEGGGGAGHWSSSSSFDSDRQSSFRHCLCETSSWPHTWTSKGLAAPALAGKWTWRTSDPQPTVKNVKEWSDWT